MSARTSSDDECIRLHALLADISNLADLGGSDRSFADTHLASCHQCRQERQLLAQIAMQWPHQTTGPFPDARIHSSLRATVHRRRHAPLMATLVERVAGWLRQPVPAYGFALVALAIVGINGLSSGPRAPIATLDRATSLADTSAPLPALTRTDSDNVLANFQLLDRERQSGRPDSAARLLPHGHD